jgi:hypothetical protein
MTKKLWGGRFSQDSDAQAWSLNASIDFDQRLAQQDIRASLAWASALQAAGILTDGETRAIKEGLRKIASEFKQAKFFIAPTDEDIHTVRVDIQVSPVTNYLPLTTAPELRGLPADYTAEVSPSQVSILIIGPQPILDEITGDPSLVLAYVDLTGLEPGQYELPFEYENPSGVSVELFPSEAQVTINEPQ